MVRITKTRAAVFAAVFLLSSGAGFYAAIAQDQGSSAKPSGNQSVGSYDDLPDQIPVIGDHLKEGFADKRLVLAGEFEEPPASPAEALRLQSQKGAPTVVPVFDAEGKQIDTFTVGSVNVPGGKSVQFREDDTKSGNRLVD